MEIIDAPERANERLFLDRLPAREFRRQTLPPPDRRIARARRRQSSRQGSDLAANAKRFYGIA
jgi:hypothetical protein